MVLSELIETARNGELKGLSAKDKPDDVIIDYINTALVALHNRFILKVGEAVITITPNKSLYSLNRSSKDIFDGIVTTNYGKQELSKIISIKDNVNNIYNINDFNDEFSLVMYTYDTIQTQSIFEKTTHLHVVVSLMPTAIPLDADMDYKVDVPRFLLEPLLHYVGYRAHGSLDGNVQAENNTHLMRFNLSCNEIENRGLIPGDSTTRSVTLKGFI